MSQLDNPISYFFYAKGRWGTAEALRRVWQFHLHPRNGAIRIKQFIYEQRLVDRRKKKSYSREVYAINRDGDHYLVECPNCHNYQSLSFYAWQEDDPCRQCGKQGESHFHCFHCPIGFKLWFEDGMQRIQDYREGNVPLPAKMVRDEGNKFKLGIAADAPWWWRRYVLYRDLQPNGKDGHGHQPYTIWQIDPEWTKSQMMQESPESCDRAQGEK